MFSSTTSLAVFRLVVWLLPHTSRGELLGIILFSSSLLYFIIIYFILLLLFVIVCRACPSLIVAQPGGGDGFLFCPLRIPFLSVVRLWSPFATASGSVALADAHYLLCYIYICYVIVVVLPLSD